MAVAAGCFLIGQPSGRAGRAWTRERPARSRCAVGIAGGQEGEIESLGIYRFYYLIGKPNVFYLHHYSIRDLFLTILLSCSRLLQNSRRGFAWREYIFAKGWGHG